MTRKDHRALLTGRIAALEGIGADLGSGSREGFPLGAESLPGTRRIDLRDFSCCEPPLEAPKAGSFLGSASRCAPRELVPTPTGLTRTSVEPRGIRLSISFFMAALPRQFITTPY